MLFKGLGVKEKQNSINCQISHCKIRFYKFKPVCIYCLRVNEVFVHRNPMLVS